MASFLRPRGVALDRPPKPAVSTLLFVADFNTNLMDMVVAINLELSALVRIDSQEFQFRHFHFLQVYRMDRELAHLHLDSSGNSLLLNRR